MKIIRTDNYDRDTEPDTLVAENVHSGYGELIVDLLNNKESGGKGIYEGTYNPNFFRLVPDSYVLKRGWDDLV